MDLDDPCGSQLSIFCSVIKPLGTVHKINKTDQGKYSCGKGEKGKTIKDGQHSTLLHEYSTSGDPVLQSPTSVLFKMKSDFFYFLFMT